MRSGDLVDLFGYDIEWLARHQQTAPINRFREARERYSLVRLRSI